MKNNDFFMCEEDNVFDQLSALYEDLQPSVYSNAPALDLNFDWDGVEELLDTVKYEDDLVYEEYSSTDIDFQLGDILLARVYQENADKDNLIHNYRPFLVIYANATRAYGFQLTTSYPASLRQYLVEIPNPEAAGLKPGNFMVNMVRGVDFVRLIKKIGHITEEQKQAILDKLHEIQENKDGLYNDCPLNDRLDHTIKNVSRIQC